MTNNQEGLYEKYTITNRETGETIFNAFVLRPDRDQHAFKALQSYATSVMKENFYLAEDIMNLLMRIKEDQLTELERKIQDEKHDGE